jgi:uncharacterized membrane protein
MSGSSKPVDLKGRLAIVLASVMFLTASASASEDGHVGLLYISDPVRVPVVKYLRTDPLFSITLVAASLRGFGGWEMDNVQRAVRLYMPRNYEDLITRYDVIVLDNANVFAVPSNYIEMLARGAREGENGLLMTGGWESFGGHNNPSWGQTAIGDVLPTEDFEGTWVEKGRVVIDNTVNEFMSSIPWEKEKEPWMFEFHHNLVAVKAGGTLLAHTEDNLQGPEEHPLFVTWELPSGGRVFACTGEISMMSPFYGFKGWRYYGDFGANLALYLAERPVPQDVELVHLVRETIFTARTRNALLLSLLEFTENLGANTGDIMNMMDEIDELAATARPLYMELRFEEVLMVYDEVNKMFAEVEFEAMKLKNRALMWIFIVEWLAVSGVAILAGVLLWSIMVRRRLYREVGVTKFLD